MKKIILYTYCKSSAAYRARIALNLKNIPYKPVYINLLKDGGENYKAEYKQVNAQAMVPTLIADNHTLTQSIAIIEYLEETYPKPALLPEDHYARAQTRSYAQMVACDIHPLNNLRVLDYLRRNLETEEDKVMDWYRRWIDEGFQAIETRLADSNLTGDFCIGDSPTMGDVYLVPQVYNAYRYQCDMDNFPIIRRINENCLNLSAFKDAVPENQADFNS